MAEQVEAGPFFYIHETADGLCVAVDDDEASPEIWLPKRWRDETISFERKGVSVMLFAPEELLLKKGLI